MTQPTSRRVLGMSERGLLELAGKMSGVGYWRYDALNSQVNWSEQVFVIHGVDPYDFDDNYEQALQFYHPEDRPLVDRAIQDAVRTGIGFDFRFRLLRADGSLRHVACKAECERAADGSVSSVFGVFQDVTDHVTALRAAELAREDAEEKARRAAVAEELAGLGHWRAELPAGKLTWSHQLYVILGINPSEPANPKAFNKMVHPDDRGPAIARLVRYIGGEPWTERRSVRVVRPNGETRWIVGDTKIEYDAEGCPQALVGTVMDVTQQKLAERRIAESEARYRLITENSHDLVIKFSPEAEVRYVSPSIATLLGYTPEEVVGRTAEKIVYDEDRGPCRAAFVAAVAGREVPRRDYRLIHKDGSIVWVDARPRALFDDTGSIIGVTDVVRDVTARKKAEAALAASEERYRLMSDNATDMLIQCKFKGGEVTFASPGCRRTLGLESDELLGGALIERVHPEDKPGVCAYFAELVKQGPGAVGAPFHYRAHRKDGAWVWLEGQPRVFFDDDGSAVMIQDVVRDITTRKTLEIELDQARLAAQAASQVKSEFLSNMSHELRTPLTSIVGFSSMLKDEESLSPLGVRAASHVCNSADALLSIVNDILDFSKLEAGQVSVAPQPVDVGKLLQAAVGSLELQARDKGLTLHYASKSLPNRLWLDDARVRQILVNLLSNGVKFTAYGGVSLRAAYHSDAKRLRCEVEDSGDGVPADRLDRLFKRFSQVDGSPTRAHGGAGLGLAICKGLVDAMGGDIGVRSVLGKGSVFWFEVPCRPAEALETAPLSFDPEGQARHNGLRVLVAGDDARAQEAVRLTLTPLGIGVTETLSGDALLRVAEASPFDVILLASRQLGKDTMSAVQALRGGDGPNDLTPILAFADAPAAPRDWDGDLDAYLQTPVVADALVLAIDHWTSPRAVPVTSRSTIVS